MGELRVWSWVFLVLYVGGMLAFGVIGMRRVRGGDDFATARGSYGPLALAFAFTATTASGATFLGVPGFGYDVGVAAIPMMILYPLGVYTGVWLCLRVVSRAGEEFGSRSIPEYLGDRYDSDFLRIAVAVFSLMLLFYLAGQLVAGLVMFERMLGLEPAWALGITAFVLLLYVSLGGAHADILTDATQGALMLVLAIAVVIMFGTGVGVEGGFAGVLDAIRARDPQSTEILYSGNSLFDSYWDMFAILAAHLPLGLLPHIGNKLWALRSDASRQQFLVLSFTFGLTLAMMGVGGILARAVLGDALMADGVTSNEAMPALFIELFPAWLAALLGVGILAAVMSTADGLVVSSSQIFANDLYRRTLAPRWHAHVSEDEIDRRVLSISRWGSGVVMVGAVALAWALLDMNVALLVWTGVGGMMAALAGPLVLGVLWRRVTRAGAIAGFFAGIFVFVFAKATLIPVDSLSGTVLAEFAVWLEAQAPSPYACATLGEVASVLTTVVVSLRSRPLDQARLEQVFGR